MNKIIISLFILVIIYGFYNAKQKSEPIISTQKKLHKIDRSYREDEIRDELLQIDSVEYLQDYICSIIDHGSYNLGFKGGVMEGGFVSNEDSPKVASFVVELSGKKSPNPYPKDAEMFYTSVCGGCHGNDGKGLAGVYPDLTKETLFGIQKRKESLETIKESYFYGAGTLVPLGLRP